MQTYNMVKSCDGRMITRIDFIVNLQLMLYQFYMTKIHLGVAYFQCQYILLYAPYYIHRYEKYFDRI